MLSETESRKALPKNFNSPYSVGLEIIMKKKNFAFEAEMNETLKNSPIFEDYPDENAELVYGEDVTDEELTLEDIEVDMSEEEINEAYRKKIAEGVGKSGVNKDEVVTLPNGTKAYRNIISDGIANRRYIENDMLYVIGEIRKQGIKSLAELRDATSHLEGEDTMNLYNSFGRALRNSIYVEISSRHLGEIYKLTTRVVTELVSVVDSVTVALMFRENYFWGCVHNEKKSDKDIYRMIMGPSITWAIKDYARRELNKHGKNISSSTPIGPEEDGMTIEDGEEFSVNGSYEDSELEIVTKQYLSMIAKRKGYKPDSTAYRLFKLRAYYCFQYNAIKLDTTSIATTLGCSLQAVYAAQEKIDLLYKEFAAFIKAA